MASQSLAMGEAFGLGFQYGKRRISAMNNDEFNKLTAKQLHMDMSADIRGMIPSMTESMSNFASLQPVIIKELLAYAFELAPAAGTVAAEKVLSGDVLKTLKTLSPALNQFELIEAIINIISGLNPLPSAEAAVSPTSAVNNPPDLQNEILKIIKKVTTRPTPETIGPFQNEPITPANQSLISAGLRPDLRIPVVKKLRAPRSILIQWRKYREELKALSTQRAYSSGRGISSQSNIKLQKRVNEINRLLVIMEKKYIIP